MKVQLNAGYYEENKTLKSALLDTPLGQMVSVSDDKGLYLLEFMEKKGLEQEIKRLCFKTKAAITSGRTAIIDSIERELGLYFSGRLQEFKTPIHIVGTVFQEMVWQELVHVPYGKTRSYLAQAIAIGKVTSVRAVANANGANKLAIIIPCHRIINSNGELGGYGGGIARKQWLIDMEEISLQMS